MTKADIVAAIADKLDLSRKDAETAVNVVIDTIRDGLKSNDKVAIAGLGTFETHTRKARAGKNPRTGEEIIIPESKAPVFKAAKALKDAVK